ncbi:MAG: DUF5916 domain-containing protein [Leadbetterella sp.]
MAHFLKIFCLSTLLSIQLFAQQDNYLVKYTSDKIIIDGILDEAAWKIADTIQDFQQYFPNDNVKAEYDSHIKIVQSDKFIYVAGTLFAKGNKFITPSYRRDFRPLGNDNITLCFDTFSDKTNGFLFGTNPFGVQREGLMSNGATDGSSLNTFWDNKWYVESKIGENCWYFEAAIPLNVLRYNENSTTWNFKAYRFDSQSNETSVSTPLIRTQILMALAFTRKITFERPLKKSGRNVSLIPYVSFSHAKDFEKVNPSDGFRPSVGFDAKIGVSSGLNLDVTVNPDFSNAEADRQIVNLTRFDLNLPEQRQFFLENADLFTSFGAHLSNPFVPPTSNLGIGNQLYSPFFSRNVGIGKDTSTDLSVQNRINYGLRLSGKINSNWRIGVLNTQTASDSSRGINGENFSVLVLQKKVFSSSNVSFIYANKFFSKKDTLGSLGSKNVVGLEYNLQTKNNKWQGKLYQHFSLENNQPQNAFAHGGYLNYTTTKIVARWSHDILGAGFNAPMGFVPRNNFWHVNPTIGYNFFPKSKIFNRISTGVNYDNYYGQAEVTNINPSDTSLINLAVETDRKIGLFTSMVFQNNIRLLISANQNVTYLLKDFDILRLDDDKTVLTKNRSFTYYNLEATLTTDQRKPLYAGFTPNIGQYYDGTLTSLSGYFIYRFQPYGQIQMNYSYNDIRVSIGQRKLYVIGPNLDLTLSRKLFISNYLQYNSGIKNFNINSRLQYRFAPVSDIFLVFTNNYGTENWNSKNRAIFFKFNYWFSI